MPDMANWLRFEFLMDLVRSGWNDLLETDLSQIKYSDVNFAAVIGGAIVLIVLIKMLFVFFGRKKYAWADSGHLIYNDNENRKGSLAKIIVFLPNLLMVVPIGLIVVAISDPFLVSLGEEKKFIETRSIVYLRDVSGSMESFIPDTNIPKAKLAMDAHLRFLEMRLGKGDRTSFWVFSDNGYMVNDFIMDDKLQYFQVYDAPWGFGYRDKANAERPEFPHSRLANIVGEGGTSLGIVLGSVIRQFDRDEEVQRKSPLYRESRGRSVIIYSDSDIFDIEKTRQQVEELVSRRISIYVVVVDDRSTQNEAQYPYETNPFLMYVVSRGGKFFLASDIAGMTQAHMEIDRLEKTSVQVNQSTLRTQIFDKFIFASLLFLIILIPVGLITEPFFRDYP